MPGVRRKKRRKRKTTPRAPPPSLYCSPDLSRLLSGTNTGLRLSRGEATSRLWRYAKAHNLQDPSDGRVILCNNVMREVFGRSTLDFSSVASALAKHLSSTPYAPSSSSSTGTSSTDEASRVFVTSELLTTFLRTYAPTYAASCPQVKPSSFTTQGTPSSQPTRLLVSSKEVTSVVRRYAVSRGCLGQGGHASTLSCDAALRKLFGVSIGRGAMRDYLERHHLTLRTNANHRIERPRDHELPSLSFSASSTAPKSTSLSSQLPPADIIADRQSEDSEAEWDDASTESYDGSSSGDDSDEGSAIPPPQRKAAALAKLSKARSGGPLARKRRRNQVLDSSSCDEDHDEPSTSRASTSSSSSSSSPVNVPRQQTHADNRETARVASSFGLSSVNAGSSSSFAATTCQAAPSFAQTPGHLLHVQNLPPTMGERRWEIPNSSLDVPSKNASAPPMHHLSSAIPHTAPPSLNRDTCGAVERQPHEFLCAITCEVMRDPVIAADGHTYEREAILKWFKQSQRSPKTNEELPHMQVIPNRALRTLIEDSKV